MVNYGRIKEKDPDRNREEKDPDRNREEKEKEKEI